MKIQKNFVFKIFMLCSIFQLLLPLNVFSEKPKRIIMISVDTLRADHLSCYGYPIKTSPEIDKIASDGILFSRCFTLTPLTAPAFSTVLTSLPSYKHGAKRNGLSIYNRIKTLPYYLKTENYYSGAFVSNWPLRKKLSRLHTHFNEYKEVFTKKRWLGIINPEGDAKQVTKLALNWISKNQEKKFFLWVHYSEPHAPYKKHKKFLHKHRKFDKSVYPPGTRLKKIKNYDSEISYTDYFIGKLINELKNKKLYKSSMIIFLSDHGESFGEHNYLKHGRRLYNSTLHVPLIIKFPENRYKASKVSTIVSLLDIAPTILNKLNIKVPDIMQGENLFSKNKKQKYTFFETYKGSVLLKKKALSHIKVKPIYFGILDYPFKMLGKINFKNLRFKKIEVYNIEKDFFETNNLWNKRSEKLIKLSKILKKNIFNIKKYIKYSKKHFKQKSKISNKDMEQLKSLGYIN